MQYITSSEFHIQNSAVALGKFEGIHLGHQLLINEVKKQKEKGYLPLICLPRPSFMMI